MRRRSVARSRSSTGRARASGRRSTPGGRRGRARGPCKGRWSMRRARLLAGAGWRALHPGGPPFTLADYRVFVAAALAGPPGPAPETALSAFRRALEGTLASAGAAARRLAPDALLSLAARARRPRYGGRERRRPRPPGPALVPGGRAPSPVRRARAHAHRGAHGARVPPRGNAPVAGRQPRRRPRRRGGPGAVGHRLPRGLARLARQRAHRRLPPRLPATGLPGADLLDGHDRRGRRRRAGVPQVRPRDPAGGHRHRPLPAGPAREGARLAVRDRAPQGRRAPGPRLLHGGGLCAARRDRRGRGRRCARSITARAGG